jgi:hypothetical protein
MQSWEHVWSEEMSNRFNPPRPFQLHYEVGCGHPLLTVGSLMELDPDFLEKLNITCVITCIGTATHRVDAEVLQESRPEARVHHINFCPNHHGSRPRFPELVLEVQRHRSVLVHCKMGQKRSVITACALALALGMYSQDEPGRTKMQKCLSRAERHLESEEWRTVKLLVDIADKADKGAQ